MSYRWWWWSVSNQLSLSLSLSLEFFFSSNINWVGVCCSNGGRSDWNNFCACCSCCWCCVVKFFFPLVFFRFQISIIYSTCVRTHNINPSILNHVIKKNVIIIHNGSSIWLFIIIISIDIHFFHFNLVIWSKKGSGGGGG